MQVANIASLATVLAIAKSKAFSSYFQGNIKNQLAIFLLTANIPALLSGRMSYVDIAWPWGLFAIGLRAKLLSRPVSFLSRENLAVGAFILAGLRMGLGALLLAKAGHLNVEMPRYLYQRRRWAARGITAEGTPLRYLLTMQVEILVQCLANAGVLCVPAILCVFSYIKERKFLFLEKLGWLMWVSSLVLEHVADVQKNNFAQVCKVQKLKNQVCNVGLWNYSRHPNYFFEWCVWVSLAVASFPSLQAFWETDKEDWKVKVGITLGWLLGPFSMYHCLVNYTGARPAEFYSLQKRPEYADYQKAVNMFFPGPRR